MTYQASTFSEVPNFNPVAQLNGSKQPATTHLLHTQYVPTNPLATQTHSHSIIPSHQVAGLPTGVRYFDTQFRPYSPSFDLLNQQIAQQLVNEPFYGLRQPVEPTPYSLTTQQAAQNLGYLPQAFASYGLSQTLPFAPLSYEQQIQTQQQAYLLAQQQAYSLALQQSNSSLATYPITLANQQSSQNALLNQQQAQLQQQANLLAIQNLLAQQAYGLSTSAQPVQSTQPEINLLESAENHIIVAEVPGINEKDLEIYIQDGILTIKGNKPQPVELQQQATIHSLESATGTFLRSFNIPYLTEKTEIKAQLKQGILRIEIPKLKQGQGNDTYRVKISTAAVTTK